MLFHRLSFGNRKAGFVSSYCRIFEAFRQVLVYEFAFFCQLRWKLPISILLVGTSIVEYCYFSFIKVLLFRRQVPTYELLRPSVVAPLCNIVFNCKKKVQRNQ